MHRWIWAGLALGVGLVVASPRAHACGGFFCQTQPMNQAGEDILYAKEDDGTLVMIVRIVYSGTADEFAWILPVPVEPELGVGTDALFAALATSTGPSFRISEFRTEGTCRAEPQCDYPSYSGGCLGCAAYEASASVDASASFAAEDAATGVRVVSQEVIGPYETVVLSGGTAAELQTWLGDHDYDIPASSIPVMEDYVAAGQLFVALRLRSSFDTDEIQPLVLRMQHDAPCLPIRLTAIATVPDLPITAYFLGDRPAVPTNYSLIDVPLEARLYTAGLAWPTAYANAIDDAGGQAFVMDFAGAPPTLRLTLPRIDDLISSDVPTFLRELQTRGYPNDAALLAMLERFLDPPGDETVRDYANLCVFGACPAPERWDPAGLVLALEQEVRVPRAEADALLREHTVLTRLYTSMSADEMTLDPEFRFDEGIPLVSNVHDAAFVTRCDTDHFVGNAPTELVLADGTRLPSSPGAVQDADAYCRSRGASGVDRGGCTASLGVSRAAGRSGLVLSLLLVGLAWRARRRASSR